MELWPAEYDDLRPEARAVAEIAVEAVRAPSDRTASRDEQVRQQREGRARMFQPVDDAEVREIAGRSCRVFVPEGPPTGVYLHFHGGGMILGAPEMMDQSNLDLCRRFGVTVVSASYRLAPEYPYPAGPDDGLAVATWLIEHARAELGSERLLVGGESAGGYLAATTLLRVRDELGADAVARFVGANLVFGVYDWGRSPSQRGRRPHDGPDLLDPEAIEFFADCYLPGLTDDERRDPAISPAFADLRGLPPALMSVGTTDHLLDDTLWLASRWRAAGNQVELAVFPDCPHGFVGFPHQLAARWRERVDRFLTDCLA